MGLEQLRELSHTDRGGASLLGLRRAAEQLGFSAKAVRCPIEALPQMPLPAIAHIRADEGIGQFVVLGDPNVGIVKQPVADFAERWTGNLLLAVPDPTPRTEPLAPSVSPSQRFWQLLRPHRGLLSEVVFCALLMTLLAVSTSYFVQHLVDSVLVHSESTLLNALGIGMSLIVVLRTLFGAARQYLLVFMGRRIDLMLIGGYARHVMRLPMRFFETRRVGEIFSRVRDADKLRDAISGATTTAIVDGTVVVGLLTMLWFYDLPLAAAATLIVPVFMATMDWNHRGLATHSRAAMERGSHFAAHLVEDIAGVETTKACRAEDLRSDGTEAQLTSFIQSIFALGKLDVWMSAMVTLMTGLAGAAILWLGGHRAVIGCREPRLPNR